MLTRRELILSGLAASATPLLNRVRPLLDDGTFSFAFFSDTHVALKRNIEENRRMLEEIRLVAPDFAVNGGDVTDYGWTGEYENYRALIRDLGFPVRHVPGNHDVRWSPLGMKAYRDGLGDTPFGSFDHKGCHFVLLDSTVPLSHWGHYESSQLRWLEEDLKTVGRETPVFLFTHHWVGRDRNMIDNEGALLRIVEPYNVKMIFNGHGHSDLLWHWEGIPGTMNKGLYQLSWQRVEVGPERIRFFRRSEQHPEGRRFAQVPRRPSRERRPVWALPLSLAAGAVVRPEIEGAKEAKWGDGPWRPIPEEGLSTAGFTPGTYPLFLRADDRTYYFGGETQVQGEPKLLRSAWQRELTGGVMSQLRLANGVLYVSAMDGSLTALRSRDGAEMWRAKTGEYCHSSPLVLADRVLVGSADGFLYAFDRRTGRELWRFETKGPVYASPAEARGIAAIAADDTVYGVDVRTGRERWRTELPPSNTNFVQSPIESDGERFFLGAWDSHLYALDARTGEKLWRGACCADRSFAFSPAIGGPCVAGPNVVVPANGNVLYCFDRASGATRWESTSPGDKFGYSSPRYRNGRIYIGCLGDNGEARCVDARSGEILWTCATGSVIYDSSPSVGEIVAIGSVSGLLNAIDPATGALLDQVRLPTGHFLSSPEQEPGRVYAATFNDRVCAFDIA
jgi:outer membrane protein assembly factor BamB